MFFIDLTWNWHNPTDYANSTSINQTDYDSFMHNLPDYVNSGSINQTDYDDVMHNQPDYVNSGSINQTDYAKSKVFNPIKIHHMAKTLTICGSVPFCDYSASLACINASIKIRDQCSLVNGSLFVIGLLVLGLIILLSNILIVTVSYYGHQKKKLSKSDIIKLSLAIADLFTGNKNLFHR